MVDDAAAKYSDCQDQVPRPSKMCKIFNKYYISTFKTPIIMHKMFVTLSF